MDVIILYIPTLNFWHQAVHWLLLPLVGTERRWPTTHHGWRFLLDCIDMWQSVSYPWPILLLAGGLYRSPQWTLVSYDPGSQLPLPSNTSLLKFSSKRPLVRTLSPTVDSLESSLRGPWKSCSWSGWGQAVAISKAWSMILLCSYSGTHNWPQISWKSCLSTSQLVKKKKKSQHSRGRSTRSSRPLLAT